MDIELAGFNLRISEECKSTFKFCATYNNDMYSCIVGVDFIADVGELREFIAQSDVLETINNAIIIDVFHINSNKQFTIKLRKNSDRRYVLHYDHISNEFSSNFHDDQGKLAEYIQRKWGMQDRNWTKSLQMAVSPHRRMKKHILNENLMGILGNSIEMLVSLGFRIFASESQFTYYWNKDYSDRALAANDSWAIMFCEFSSTGRISTEHTPGGCTDIFAYNDSGKVLYFTYF